MENDIEKWYYPNGR